MIPKQKPIRSKPLLRAANGRSCVRCGIDDGTVCKAHYEGTRQHQYGKAKGMKGHDVIACDLCADCHAHLSNDKRGIEHDEEMSHLCWLTLIRDYQDGLINIKGAKS